MSKAQIARAITNAVMGNDGKIAWGKAAFNGMLGFQALGSYNDYKDEGRSTLGAVAETAEDYLLWPIMGGWNWLGYQAIKNAGAVVDAYESTSTNLRQFNEQIRNQQPFRTQTWVDGPQIATQRAAGLALAKQAKYRQVATLMGDEARHLHR